ncbi:TIGR01621 family pseudouridine synthase [Thalassotalea agariperforans]
MTHSAFHLVAQTNDFIVINKSADINFHDEGEVNQGLFNQIKQQLALTELYPVHRLDKMTSGLLLLAKNKTAACHFQHLFSQHLIQKYYLAISDQKPKKKQGLIKGDMAKSRRGAWKLLRTMENPAISQFFSYGLGNGLRLFLVKPHSGKTHQIRVALASIGAQILGDPLYAKGESKNQADRGYLHAYALNFHWHGQAYHYVLAPTQGQHFEKLELPTETLLPWNLNWPKIK